MDDKLLQLNIHDLENEIIREWYYSKKEVRETSEFSPTIHTFVYRFAMILNNKMQIELCQKNSTFKRAYDEYIVSDKVGDYEYFARLFYKYS
jgi:hypothetical protein